MFCRSLFVLLLLTIVCCLSFFWPLCWIVIDTDCIGSHKSNYHTIMTTAAPSFNRKQDTNISCVIIMMSYYFTFCSSDGSYSTTLKLPDTITSWTTRGFSISPTRGLGIARNVQVKIYFLVLQSSICNIVNPFVRRNRRCVEAVHIST
jgi:hypothetical protein